MGKSWKEVMFDLVIKTNEEERSERTKFDPSPGFNLKSPIFVVFGHRWPACMPDDEDGREVHANSCPKNHVETNHQLPSQSQHDGNDQPAEEVHEDQRCIKQPHLRKFVLLGLERGRNHVFQAVVPHQVTNQRRQHWPEHVGLEVLLEELAQLATGFVFFLGKGQRPRMDVGVSANHVRVCMVLHVVLVSPVLH